MKITKGLIGALVGLMCAAIHAPAQEPRVTRRIPAGNPPPQNYNWHPHNKMGIAAGTFTGIKNNNRALIKDADGTILEVPLFYLAPLDLSYILHQLATFPEYVNDVQHEPANAPVLDMKTAGLPTGPLKEWRNQGTVGGAFHSMNNPPEVVEIQGRKAVKFDYSRWYIDPKYNAMVADVLAPKSLGEGKPFTLSAWVLHPEPLDEDDPETILSWHSKGGDHGTTIDYKGDSYVAGIGVGAPATGIGVATAVEPVKPKTQWTHMAYVYTGGLMGEFRTYENGVLKRVSRYDHLPSLKDPTNITSATVVLHGELNVRENKPAYVAAYVGKRDCHYWWQMRHVSYWGQCKELGWTQPGEFSVRFDKLEPGTRYYYRMLSLDDPNDWWRYPYTGRRWANGAGSFVTPSADGKPAEIIPPDNDQLMFLGVQWGSRWYMSYEGPSGWYRGYIGDLKLYDRALDELDIRGEIGYKNAFAEKPANGARCGALQTALNWRAGSKGVAKFRVYLSPDRKAVESGASLLQETTTETIPQAKLLPGRTYFWRVEQMDAAGNVKAPGDVWTFRVAKGEATDPFPGNGDTVNLLGDFRWLPGKEDIKRQRVFLAESEKEALASAKPLATLSGTDKGCLKPEALVAGKRYFWRVESVQADDMATTGEVWSFRVRDYFKPEPDGPVSEPYFDELAPGRQGSRVMEGRGHPAITTPGADEEDVRTVAYGTSKVIGKSADLKRHLMSYPCASTISSFEGSPEVRDFWCGSYGGVPHWTMTMHEMGHQVLMNGLGPMTPDFYDRLNEVFLAHGDNNAWLGDYAAGNIHENMACAVPLFTTARDRENLLRTDSATYYLLEEYLPGDLYVELHPANGLALSDEDVVLRWDNRAGLDQLVGEHYAKLDATTGTFTSVGTPQLRTVGAVTAVQFHGNDALTWDMKTMYGLEGNRAWSAEFWAWRDNAPGPGVLLSWGPQARGVRFLWGNGNEACRLGGNVAANWPAPPAPGSWQHIAYTFEGGGLKNGEGALRVFLNGEKVYEKKHKLDLEPHVPICVGGLIENGKVSQGFSGALAHARVYNYALSPGQVADHFSGEKENYRREQAANIGGCLYVDLDARLLAEPGAEYHRPLYSKVMRKPWLRSWANHGILQGRMHNDISDFWNYSGSAPIYKEIAGARAPIFRDKDRMVGVMDMKGSILKKAPGTLEAWVYSEAQARDEVALEWGGFQLDSRFLKPGWQHVGLLFSDGGKTEIYINGEKAGEMDGALRPGRNDHLHFGGRYDPVRWNWKNYFNGAIALLRVHQTTLTPAQLAENYRKDYISVPHEPKPANDELVAAERKPRLSWNPGLLGEGKSEVFFGETPGAMKSAGAFAPGEYQPALQPAKTYYWRAGGGPVCSFSTREGLVVSVSAANLPNGRLPEWKNEVPAPIRFVPADRGDILAPMVKEFKAARAIQLAPGKALTSSFDAPECLKNGPFTIYYEVANENPSPSVPILTWGTAESRFARVLFGTYDDDRKCMTWAARGGAWAERPPEGKPFLAYPAGNTVMASYWKKFAIAYDGGKMTLYLNGTRIREDAVQYSQDALGKLVIGFQNGPEEAKLLLRDLRIFDKALAEADVKQLCKETAPSGASAPVWFSAEGLDSGKRARAVDNQGTLKGRFNTDPDVDRAPEVKDLGGRKCVAFNGAAMMQSDVAAPRAVLDDHPFTLEMLVYCEEDNDSRVMAFTQEVTRRHTSFAAGRGSGNRGLAREVRSVDWNNPENATGKWVRLAWVYDGGPESTVRLYRDGKLNSERSFMSLDTIGGYPMTIGGMMHPGLGEKYLFKGGIAEIRIYDYPRTSEEIAAAAQR